ncbi:hypothetical protein O3P69_017631 [Scylla paramamosain]|uniref:Uncharacterized protein n=1 Tax=Scylla paramamosain TaxID=85552 RepID=A0AAW0TY04_SCYPA
MGEGTWLPHLCPRPPGYWNTHLETPGRLTWQPLRQDAIFFLQTSCTATFTAREACAVESAARHHPRRPIQVLLTTPTLNAAHPLLQVVKGVGNIHLSWLDLDQVFSAAPLEEWHRARQWLSAAPDHSKLNHIHNTSIPANQQHPKALPIQATLLPSSGYNKAVMMSDAARLELLRRYGGTYLDLDTITLAPLPSTYAYVARLSDRLISNGVMSFPPGHVLLQARISLRATSTSTARTTSPRLHYLRHPIRRHAVTSKSFLATFSSPSSTART